MLKNLYKDYTKKHRSLPYILILILVFIITYCISKSFFGVYIGFYTSDIESARSLLSTIIQSEAAMLAIVVTLSLVAVQQTASSYSTRVIEVFKSVNSNPDFYILLFIYLFTIIYEMWVLKQIHTDNLKNIANFEHSLFSSFEAHIWICYAFGIFSLVSLFPYIQNTLDLLKPLNMIEQISKNISQETIESFVSTRIKISDDISKIISKETTELAAYTGIEEGILISKTIPQKESELSADIGTEEDIFSSAERLEKERETMKSRVTPFQHQVYTEDSSAAYGSLGWRDNSDDNPIQQIFDIVVSSQIKHDFTTSKYGLLKVLTCIETLTEGKISLKFHPEIVKSLDGFVIFSVILKDFDSSFSLIIPYLENIGIKAIEQKIEPVVDIVVKSLNDISILVTEQRMEDLARHAALSLTNIGIRAVEQKIEPAVNTVLISLNDISILATEQRMEDLAIWATLSIKNIGIKALKEDLINRTSNEDPFNVIVTGIEMNLRSVGKKAAELKLEKETMFIVQFLRDIGKESINNKLIFETRQSVKYLEEIGRLSIRQELEEPITMIGILFDELGVEALKLDPGENGSKQELDEFETLITVCSNFIGNYGKLAAEKNFEYIAKDTVVTLRNIGVYAAQRRYILGTTASLSSIKSIGIILAEQGIDHAVETVVLSLRQIGEISIQNKISNQAGKALLFIDEIGELIVKRNMHQSIKSVVLSFDILGKTAFQNNLTNIINGMIIPLERFGIKAAKQKMDFNVKNIIIVLKNIGEVSINYNEYDVRQTIQSLEEIGKSSVIEKLEKSIKEAVISIKEIGSKAIQAKLNKVAYQSQSSLENILSLAIDRKLFNHSIILESLEELNDIINAYDDSTQI